MNNRTGKFRQKGNSLLMDIKSPSCMKDFLNDVQDPTLFKKNNNMLPEKEIHKPASTQNHINPEEQLERLHIQIRKGLSDKLIELVYKRKRNPEISRNKSTQRAIIEESLEEYFSRHVTQFE
jgi:hypothetical protein